MLELSVEFSNTQQLYRNYMPFVSNGGLFLITHVKVDLGDTVKVSVTLPDDLEATTFEAKVVWVNPVGAQGGRPAGVGVALSEAQIQLRTEIEKLLNRKLNSVEVTSTI
ncbi:PilZ domain-containing protein [Psychrobium sp. 1_MG-2023]|uniref:PilZ domain-containing protein n=1 Tax=Psychrobium sp. 1_MG-2023 TaxID=3062624 RepID=UPI002697FF85|nr:PilZ domain-containing protein [Psychrobium sp. 1_MG-2023]MDP2561686.1 PilZ domain-containing protein [Psychrobium sp. 1_MG-2023]